MKFISTIALLLFTYYAYSQTDTVHYKIYSTKGKKQVTVDDIVNNLGNVDILFFGEEHNDSIGHAIELDLFKKIAEKYPDKTALSMEMFETDCQTVLNEYVGGLIREKNFITEARAWPNYTDYRPLIETAKALHTPVIAANAPARYVNMVNRMGLYSLQQLDKTAKNWLPPLPVDTATGKYYENFAQIMGGHASMPGMQLYQAQNLWDATMGWFITKFYKTHKDYKLLQLNGGFHSDEKLGTAAQLKKYAPKARILNIACYSDDNNYANPDWGKYSINNDYILLTEPKLTK